MRKLLLLTALVFGAAQAHAQFQITQVRTRGSAGGNDELVLVCNSSGTSQSVAGYKLNGSNNTGTTSTRATAGTGTTGGTTTLAAGECYLFANGGTGGYNDFAYATASYPTTQGGFTIVGYTTFATGITDTGGVALLTSGDAIVDQVGFSTGSAYKEGTPLAPLTSNPNDDTYSRTQDTGDNAADFVLVSGSLPVEIASFTATADGTTARLRWATASETNNAAFHVEHLRGAAWAEVGRVGGAGTTAERQAYALDVTGLAAGTHAFRLRQVDLDGAAHYSETVEATVVGDAPLALDVRGRAVRVVVREAQAVRVEAFDALGRRVATLFDGSLGADAAVDLALPAAGLAPGLYVVRATGERSAVAHAVVVR